MSFLYFIINFLISANKKSSWSQFANSQEVKIWQGYSFDNFILKHIILIKGELGISGILSNQFSWNYNGNATEKGTQIDLIIDRNDNCINIIEAKFYNTAFEINAAYHNALINKKELFIEKTKTKKNVFYYYDYFK